MNCAVAMGVSPSLVKSSEGGNYVHDELSAVKQQGTQGRYTGSSTSPASTRYYFLLAALMVAQASFTASAGVDLPSMTLVIMSAAGVQTAPISGSFGK